LKQANLKRLKKEGFSRVERFFKFLIGETAGTAGGEGGVGSGAGNPAPLVLGAQRPHSGEDGDRRGPDSPARPSEATVGQVL